MARVSLEARTEDGGSKIACRLACDGREVDVIFGERHVVVRMAEGPGSISLEVQPGTSATLGATDLPSPDGP